METVPSARAAPTLRSLDPAGRSLSGAPPARLPARMASASARRYLEESGRDDHAWRDDGQGTLSEAAARRWLRAVDSTRRSWLRDAAVAELRSGSVAAAAFLRTLDRSSWVFQTVVDGAPRTAAERLAIAQDLAAVWAGALCPDDPLAGRPRLASATVTARIPGGVAGRPVRGWTNGLEPTAWLARALLAGAWQALQAADGRSGSQLPVAGTGPEEQRLWESGVEAGPELGAPTVRSRLGSLLWGVAGGSLADRPPLALTEVRKGRARLGPGARGLAVVELQEMLLAVPGATRDRGRLDPLARLASERGRGRVVDGSFGRATMASVRAFQGCAGLPRSGVLDRSTLRSLEAVTGQTSRFAALASVRAGTATVREGARGLRVEGIQRRLRRLGYRLRISGVYDRATRRAVEDFAPEAGGVVDRDVLRSIESAVAAL